MASDIYHVQLKGRAVDEDVPWQVPRKEHEMRHQRHESRKREQWIILTKVRLFRIF